MDRVSKNIISGYSVIDQSEISDDALAEISLILEMRCGFNISIYKDKCMKRRIAIRMRSCRCQDAAEYCNRLRQNDNEIDLLKKALTIHVSHFFRNPTLFEKLRTEVIPALFKKAADLSDNLSFLSLGCASGEEAYTIGIILREFFAGELLENGVEIRGFDIDAEILVLAKAAEYYDDRLKELSESLRERYFTQVGSRMQLSSEIRGMVTFHQENIMDVALFGRCQMVLCRNTLIYFTREDQEKILSGIARILPMGGILVLGKSETLVGEARKLFATVCPTERIYRRL
ncbi:MAG: protein-glutamate O-methyltransferase CheR [Desulfuromonadaceae bacterium]|nr:protein-glutamate O-methyltransferase CheR [Desulfuromonadaceae bacterium]MDD2854436.1 protein-glutamate O-methyltransferase CheR [Desulfuromonadaceae bacterium]